MCFTNVRAVFLVGSGCGAAEKCWEHCGAGPTCVWIPCRGGAGPSWGVRHLALSTAVSEPSRLLLPMGNLGLFGLRIRKFKVDFLPGHFSEAHFSPWICSHISRKCPPSSSLSHLSHNYGNHCTQVCFGGIFFKLIIQFFPI